MESARTSERPWDETDVAKLDRPIWPERLVAPSDCRCKGSFTAERLAYEARPSVLGFALDQHGVENDWAAADISVRSCAGAEDMPWWASQELSKTPDTCSSVSVAEKYV